LARGRPVVSSCTLAAANHDSRDEERRGTDAATLLTGLYPPAVGERWGTVAASAALPASAVRAL